jgi:uncharacterized OsmC-like protein
MTTTSNPSTASAATTTPTKPKRAPIPLNGVDTPTLFATLDAVKAQPELARFTFRASNRWIKGTHSRSRAETFTGAGGDHAHVRAYEYDSDHPLALCGADQGPTPVEYLLGALAGCLGAGIANIAAARGVELEEVESTVEGDIDLVGLLGIDGSVRNAYSGIRVSFRIKGDATPEKLRQIVEQSRARSAVYDALTRPIPIAIEVTTD